MFDLDVHFIEGDVLFAEHTNYPHEQIPFALLWHTPFPVPTVDRQGFSNSSTTSGWQDDSDDQD